MKGAASLGHRKLGAGVRGAAGAGGWKLRRSAPTPMRSPRGRIDAFFGWRWLSLEEDASDAAVAPVDVDGCWPISREGVSESQTLLSGQVRPH